MSVPAPSGAASLAALAERVCAAAGTDLAAVLSDLLGGEHDPRTPAAIRAGWAAPDTDIPEALTQES
ncbi:hypothetical protein ACPW96_21725 [Micromonospora sp. DT81.3]|uniref:hypothetical protein n=1 Tax=Micromonospora sp. DT81.3 TaxID=3416523 RepID=UPI003CF3855E